ncbi:sigma-70 family RNA polymerase sigma factor [Paenibacillus donghaensis]|uniref:RNA polymerase sigma-70 region 4 domain-containing protein n=1 Tax=Paenibacillus donghaensis TaxID=414771 RepID=A0A2Z2KSE7_9BACL|nr:sigma-70 family RNA polymerase sigma factor [Paenibacillus donghaensis]ASA23501.1 hypothetical protein B9T62_23480 [Paenibacillus donghaensis]
MKTNSEEDLYSSIEKAFSSYVKSCMTFMSRNFFKLHDQEMYRTGSLEEIKEVTLRQINAEHNDFAIIDQKESLFKVVVTLSSFEKNLLYLKYHEEKPDWKVAELLGVSRQAITKSKKKLLIKIKDSLNS